LPEVPYLSAAWAEAAMARVRGDAAVLAAMAGHPVSVLTVVEHAPPDRVHYLYASFDGHGSCDLRAGHDVEPLLSAVPEPSFTIRGDYATFAALRRGELKERQAILHGKLHFTGHRLKALALAHPLQALAHALAQVPCEI
jgi:hypothetical protein